MLFDGIGAGIDDAELAPDGFSVAVDEIATEVEGTLAVDLALEGLLFLVPADTAFLLVVTEEREADVFVEFELFEAELVDSITLFEDAIDEFSDKFWEEIFEDVKISGFFSPFLSYQI